MRPPARPAAATTMSLFDVGSYAPGVPTWWLAELTSSASRTTSAALPRITAIGKARGLRFGGWMLSADGTAHVVFKGVEDTVKVVCDVFAQQESDRLATSAEDPSDDPDVVTVEQPTEPVVVTSISRWTHADRVEVYQVAA